MDTIKRWIAPIFGMRYETCTLCNGRGQNSRGDHCWPCGGEGKRFVKKT